MTKDKFLKGGHTMTAIETVSFWLAYGIVITIISAIYIHHISKEMEQEHERAERYKERYEAIKRGER